jgi:hypothetical protein
MKDLNQVIHLVWLECWHRARNRHYRESEAPDKVQVRVVAKGSWHVTIIDAVVAKRFLQVVLGEQVLND